jgi:hypothetical protein
MISSRCSCLSIALLAALLSALALVPSARAALSVEEFTASATEPDGTPATLAGSHPGALQIRLYLDTEAGTESLHDLNLTFPPSLLINPEVVVTCNAAQFATPRNSPHEASASGESCPDPSQVGVIKVTTGTETRTFGLFELEPAVGSLASLGASPFGVPLRFDVQLSEPDLVSLRLDAIPESLDLRGLDMTIWGTPGQESGPADHDPLRGNCLNEQTGGSWGQCTILSTNESFLTLPTTSCGTPLQFGAELDSAKGEPATAKASIGALGVCRKALTTPKLQLMTDWAAARTGLAVNLEVNDGGGITNPGGIARPAIYSMNAALPEALTVNPSLGAGLGTCSEAEFSRETASSEPGAGCPSSSKIGTVTVEGPLGLREPLTGSIYLATPYQNPNNSLLGLFLLARNAKRGIIVKSTGHMEPDPHTGALLASFENLPRLLYTHFTLTLREGQRSTFISPPTCGSYRGNFSFASWAELAIFKTETSLFLISHGLDGGPCPNGLPPFSPALLAGSLNPRAATETPLDIRMTRTDAEQEITSYSTTLPPGLLADLRGVPFCPDSAIDRARARTGLHGAQEELDDPSCPAASLIGHTTAGYGVGGTLAWAPGSLYLAGPYHGSPLSTVAIDSALIGPFDLGVVVVRSAIRIDPRSAQVSIDSSGSDPIPHIIRGIPLHLRDIRIHVDRPSFTRTGTSCDPTQVQSSLTGSGADPFTSTDDPTAISTDRYQLLNCSLLPFKPKLKFRFTSGFKRRAFPSLRTELRANPGDANLRFVSVTLPRTEFIVSEHLRNVCTKPQFAADACPADSVYGTARVFTPLLDQPLEGKVYLRASAGGLPDMVFGLSGRGGVQIEVVGKIDSVHESLRATFTGLPDAPISKFVMTLNGGKQGLIQNEKNICNFPQFANARLVGQSNLGEALKPHLETRCPKTPKSKRADHKHGGSR